MLTVSQLFIYPIKSLGGIEVNAAQLTDRGFEYDRRWMLVDSDNRFLTQREHPAMCLLQTEITEESLVVYHKNNVKDRISVPLQPLPVNACTVTVWDDQCPAWYVSSEADKWLSGKLACDCRLVYMPEMSERKVDQRYAGENELTSFSDGYPVLIIGQASLDDLNGRLESPLGIERFRPNIVFTGGLPYEEDTMQHICINDIDLFGVKLCGRCTIITIDQSTAAGSKEPLKTLSRYRMKNNKVYFGQNILYKQTGKISTGDPIVLISSKPAADFDTAAIVQKKLS